MKHTVPLALKAVVLVALAALGACATHTPEHFYKPGVTSEQQATDEYECERDTRQVAGSFQPGPAGQHDAQDFMYRCMRSRGYMYGAFR